MRTMYDSTTAADIPADATMVGGYVDGANAWSDSDWQRFTGKILVRICIFNDRMDAQVIDVEPGNNDAVGALPWIRDKWARGEIPTVYCSTDLGPVGYRIGDVRAACDAAGVRHPLFWVAHYDGIDQLPDDAEVVAKQYAHGS